MNKPLVAFWVVGLSIVGVGLYGFIEGVPERDIVSAVRAGDLPKVKRLLERDPALANAKVYPQAASAPTSAGTTRPARARVPGAAAYVIHDAADVSAERLPVLEALVAAGARLDVRLEGRTLLHDAASRGNAAVAAWLIDRGADVNAVNDCKDGCAESGWRPVHYALRLRPDELLTLLVSRGASIDASDTGDRTALHVAGANGGLGSAFDLCRLARIRLERTPRGTRRTISP